MRLRRIAALGLCLMALLATAGVSAAQDFRGRINGTVTDNTGAVLPGVTVTATQPGVDSTAGAGHRRGGRVPLHRAARLASTTSPSSWPASRRSSAKAFASSSTRRLTVNQQLQVATLQETVTVTRCVAGRRHDDHDDGHQLHQGTADRNPERPRRVGGDVAGAGHPDAGLRRRRIARRHADRLRHLRDERAESDEDRRHRPDGRHRRQRRLLRLRQLRGIPDRRRRQRRRAASRRAPRCRSASSRAAIGSPATGTATTLGKNTIGDNLPDNLRVANSKDDDGFFVRTPLNKGNPVDHQYDINFNVGGPIWKKKLWFFYSYRLDDQYKVVLGFPELARSKLTNDYTGKLTFQLNRNNQLIGFTNKRNKLQDRARFRSDHAAERRAVSVVEELPVEARVDQRAEQHDVPRRAVRRLGQLLPAAADE